MGKAGSVVGEFLVGLEVGTAQRRGLNRDIFGYNVRKVNRDSSIVTQTTTYQVS